MQKIIWLIGIQASGKSTWAEEFCQNNKSFKRVNKDEIRAPLLEKNGKWDKNIEKEVLKIQNEKILYWLISGYSVIIDNTHLEGKHKINLQNLLKDNGFVIGDNLEWEDKYFDFLLPECIERDAKRENSVGKKVILETFKKYFYKPHFFSRELNDCIIVDLDGTLSLFGDRNPYDRDFSLDEPNLPVLNLLWHETFNRGCKMFLFSGRKEKYRGLTVSFLKNKCDLTEDDYTLVMRADNDTRKDYLVKLDFYNQFIKDKYNPVFAVDDRKQICYLWLHLGIFVFNVNQFDLDY